MLAASIESITGPNEIRVVLSSQAIDSTRPFLGAICRICTPRETLAYVQEPYDGVNLYAWVERNVTLEDLAPLGHNIYEIRRRASLDSELPRVISMAELKREEANSQKGSSRGHSYFVKCVLHSPEPEDPWKDFFDIGRLIDLPPDGYPLSETPLEGIRNMIMKRDPGSRARQWATHQRILFLQDAAEERHANRVLDNERLADSSMD